MLEGIFLFSVGNFFAFRNLHPVKHLVDESGIDKFDSLEDTSVIDCFIHTVIPSFFNTSASLLRLLLTDIFTRLSPIPVCRAISG